MAMVLGCAFGPRTVNHVGVKNSARGVMEIPNVTLTYTYYNLTGYVPVVSSTLKKTLPRGVISSFYSGNHTQAAGPWYSILAPHPLNLGAQSYSGGLTCSAALGRKRKMLGSYSGSLTCSANIGRKRSMLGSYIGGFGYSSTISRRRSLLGSYSGGLVDTASIFCHKPLLGIYSGSLDLTNQLLTTNNLGSQSLNGLLTTIAVLSNRASLNGMYAGALSVSETFSIKKSLLGQYHGSLFMFQNLSGPNRKGSLAPISGSGSIGFFIRLIGLGSLAAIQEVAPISTTTRTGTLSDIGTCSTAGALTAAGVLSKKIRLLGVYGGSLNANGILNLRSVLHGQYSGGLTASGALSRKRKLFGTYNGSLEADGVLGFDLTSNTVFHVSMKKREVLLTAIIQGWHTNQSTFNWTLQTIEGSGYERLLTPHVYSTRLENIIPYGYYVVGCEIDNGEGRVRKNKYTVLVDAP